VLFGVLAVQGGVLDSVRGGLLIAATANVANLFDRAPGRVVKVSLVGGAVALAFGGLGWALTGPLVVLGAGAAMLWPDLRERCMLGDTGANIVGAAVGWAFVVALGAAGEWVVLAVMVLLNLASERISFTRVIDAVAPLRWADRLGTLAERRVR
jgi:UDP-GlcNAc:undecaprenyl-phosphate GlcNAc-1-phosphate transferase